MTLRAWGKGEKRFAGSDSDLIADASDKVGELLDPDLILARAAFKRAFTGGNQTALAWSAFQAGYEAGRREAISSSNSSNN
jgi:hypothetical protein